LGPGSDTRQFIGGFGRKQQSSVIGWGHYEMRQFTHDLTKMRRFEDTDARPGCGICRRYVDYDWPSDLWNAL